MHRIVFYTCVFFIAGGFVFPAASLAQEDLPVEEVPVEDISVHPYELLNLDTAAYDTAAVDVRDFDEDEIISLRSSPKYQYARGTNKALNFVERVMEWLKKMLEKLAPKINIPEGPGSTAGTVILIILATLIVTALVIFLSKANFRSFLLRRGKRLREEYIVIDENIHEIDYADELSKASTEKNYRRAIRLYYLKSLKALSDEGMIDWKPNKTNRDYLQELKNKKYLPHFKEITFIFDYTWYGDFPVDEALFKKSETDFNRFINAVQSGKIMST